MTKRIIFFDANISVVPAIKYAQSRGFHTISCDNKKENPGHKEADETLPISTLDYGDISSFIKKVPVDGVVYFASGPGSFAGCRAIEEFNLPGIKNTVKETLSFKNNFRKFLQENGFSSCPKFILFNGTVIPESIKDLPFPVIVKPTDCGGNNGITKVCKESDLQEAVNYAHSVSKSGNIIIEEFIDTDLQVNGDCIIEDGKVKLSFLGKHMYSAHSDILPYSTIFGDNVIPKDIRERIDAEIEKLVSTIGIKSGALNTEFRISKTGKIYFIEVNSRHSGNFIYQLMNKAYGLSLEEIAVKLAIGEKLNIANSTPNGFFAYALVHSSQDGILDNIEISEELNNYIIKKLIFKKPGDEVKKFTKLTDRLGIMLLQFPTSAEMNKIIDNFSSYYTVNLSK